MKMEKPDDLLCKYAESYANRIKQATRTWTTLAVLSLYCLCVSIPGETADTSGNTKVKIPLVGTELSPQYFCLWLNIPGESVEPPGNAKVRLPLVGTELSTQYFAIVAMGLLAALLTHWQEVLNRAHNLRQHLVRERIETLEKQGVLDANDEWDGLVTISTQAVWGITSSLARSSNPVLRWAALPYLLLLKVMSFAVHGGLPGIALLSLCYSYPKNHYFQSWDFLFLIFILNAVLLLLLALRADFLYSRYTFKGMWKLLTSPPPRKDLPEQCLPDALGSVPLIVGMGVGLEGESLLGGPFFGQ